EDAEIDVERRPPASVLVDGRDAQRVQARRNEAADVIAEREVPRFGKQRREVSDLVRPPARAEPGESQADRERILVDATSEPSAVLSSVCDRSRRLEGRHARSIGSRFELAL